MSHAVSQFLYLKVKPSVRPEDPTSEEGLELLDLFRATKHQSGYQSSSWGRTVEDENTIVWLVGMYSPSILHTQYQLQSLQEQEASKANQVTRMGRRPRLCAARTTAAIPGAIKPDPNSHLHHSPSPDLKHKHVDQKPGHRALCSPVPQQPLLGADPRAQRRPDSIPCRISRAAAAGRGPVVLGNGAC